MDEILQKHQLTIREEDLRYGTTWSELAADLIMFDRNTPHNRESIRNLFGTVPVAHNGRLYPKSRLLDYHKLKQMEFDVDTLLRKYHSKFNPEHIPPLEVLL